VQDQEALFQRTKEDHRKIVLDMQSKEQEQALGKAEANQQLLVFKEQIESQYKERE
jgi:hypothetical protein